METALLRSRFQRALRLSLLAALPGMAACGGAVANESDAGPSDASPSDAAHDVVVRDSGACYAIDIPDVGSSCGYEVHLAGDLSTCGIPDGGTIPPSVCAALCGPKTGQPMQYCYAWSGPGVLYCGNACVGRIPEGLRPRTALADDVVADYFARSAFLEAAAVDAFAILHDELVHHRAPRDLRHGVLVAADDEVRHARIMGAIATRFGGVVEVPIVERRAVRSLEAIALENALEGCVRETWGALLATFQADHAASERVRAAMKVISRDESEHALLGLRIAQWLDSRLDAAARKRVAEARETAIANLLAELAVEPEETLRVEAGLPTATQALLLARSLFAELSLSAA